MTSIYLLFVCLAALAAITTAGVAVAPRKNLGIIGGKSVPIESHPYQVSLEAKGNYYCSGAIVSETYIVTSAICAISVPLKNLIKIRAGTDKFGNNGTIHAVDSVHIHKDFSPTKPGNDIALISVKEPFQLDRTRQPVKLFQSSEVLDNGIQGNVTGWGMNKHLKFTGDLQVVNVPVIDKRTCKLAYKAVGIDLPENTMCAGHVVPGKGSPCLGDWGAPFVVDGRLGGIVSLTAGCGLFILPAWYTEISHYRDWIDSVIR